MVRVATSIAFVLSQVAHVYADWSIGAPVDEEFFDAGDGIFRDGIGVADADINIKVKVGSLVTANIYSAVGPDDNWLEDIEAPHGGWTNNVVPQLGTFTLYGDEGVGGYVFKAQVKDLEFVAGGGPA